MAIKTASGSDLRNSLSSGLVLLNTTTFSGVASQSINNVFSATYANYRIVLNITALSSSTSLNFKMRKAGVDSTSTAYRGAYWSILGGTQTITGNDATDNARFSKTTANGYANFVMDVFTPFSGTASSIYGYGVYSSTSDREIAAFGYALPLDAFDGFSIVPGAGTTTGTVRVYGYNN